VAPLRPHLETHFTVCAVNRRGRGGSVDNPPYSVEKEIDDLRAVLSAVGSPSYVYGHSGGAVLTLETLNRGLGVDRAVVYEPPFFVDGTRTPPPADLAERLSKLVEEGNRDEAVKTFFREGPGLSEAAIEAMSSAPFWPAQVALAHTAVNDSIIVGQGQLSPERFSDVSVPVLVLGGGASPEWMQAGVRALAELLPDATLHVLPGQTHSAAPDVLGPALVGLLLA
jgi:pimeloyl-ACP methyl ester carboxylesterase